MLYKDVLKAWQLLTVVTCGEHCGVEKSSYTCRKPLLDEAAGRHLQGDFIGLHLWWQLLGKAGVLQQQLTTVSDSCADRNWKARWRKVRGNFEGRGMKMNMPISIITHICDVTGNVSLRLPTLTIPSYLHQNTIILWNLLHTSQYNDEYKHITRALRGSTTPN